MLIYLSFLFLAFFTSNRCTVGTISMIKEVGLDSPRYPDGYIRPAKWMKKLYRIKSRVIPKFLYVEFFFPVIFAICFPINCIVYYIWSYIPGMPRFLFMVQIGLGVLHVIINTIGYYIYRRK